MSFFITGTGTGVGKTVITTGLAAALQRRSQSVCVYKPIQTGSSDFHQPEDPMQVKKWLDKPIATACSYCFSEPVAPYAADPTRLIQPEQLLNDFRQLQQDYQYVVVEGAGGARVPIAPLFEMFNLMQMLELPVVVVASPFLGTVNHTLLTVEALLNRRIPIAGVVISGFPDTTYETDPALRTLIPMMESFLEVPLLSVVPQFELSKSGFAAVQPVFDSLAARLLLEQALV